MDNIKANLKEMECQSLELLVWLEAVGRPHYDSGIDSNRK
jgi:hypothetical protein